MCRLYSILFFLLYAYNIYAQGEAGPDKHICTGGSVTIGGPDNGYCYVWDPAPGISNLNISNPKVTPATTTTYKVTVIGQDFTFKRVDEVVVTVGNDAFKSTTVTIADGATPKMSLASRGPEFWGYTDTENIEVDISACSDGKNWRAVLVKLHGNYSEEVRLLAGVQEVTGPNNNTTQANFCKQVADMKALTLISGSWFMLAAVKAHEDVHVSRLKPALEDVATNIEALIEGLSVVDNGQTQQDAILQLKALPAYKAALVQGVQYWDAAYVVRIINDHQSGAGPTYTAEQGILNPMITSICTHAKTQKWGLCASCPP